MRICYLLESTELCGGVRVVFDQARALQKRGHRVIIRALRGDHRWYPYQVKVDYVPNFNSSTTLKPDVVIATFWTTVHGAMELKGKITFHLCQGYEGDNPEYSHLRPLIEGAYRTPIPKLTIGKWVSNHLKELFGTENFEIYEIGQIIDLEIFKPLPSWIKKFSKIGSKKIKVLVIGPYEASVKGIYYALNAVRLLREMRENIHLIRVSTGNPSSEETAITHIDEYLRNILPTKLGKIYQKCDLFLASSLSYEGFGLPFAEALACGVPSVATAIPSHLSFDKNHDYALFVPEKDPVSIAEAAIKIIKDKQLRRTLRKRGLEVVNRNFRSDIIAERLESLFINALR